SMLDSINIANDTVVFDEPGNSVQEPNSTGYCSASWGFDTSDNLDVVLKVIESVLTISCFFSAPLQIYVMRKSVTHIERRTGDQCLHIFLLSMTMGDFFLTAFCYPIEQLQSVFEQAFPIIVNSFMHIMTWIGLLVSSLSLVLLNVDKLLYFKYPLRYSAYINRSRALSIIGALWMGCGAFVISIWLADCFECVGDSCRGVRMFEGSEGIYLGFMIFVCILPILSSLLVACYVLSVVTKHKRQLAEEQSLCRSSQGSTNSHMVKSRLKTFYFIFMSSVLTAVTLLPFRLHNSYKISNQLIVKMQNATTTTPLPPAERVLVTCPVFFISYCLIYLLQLNAILNPVMTVTILPQYRINFSRLFWWSEKRAEVEATTLRTRLATDL
ncbi:hypothetical protein PFISCL1PPCAC_24263, partial [Pristionchus fissidentatus]